MKHIGKNLCFCVLCAVFSFVFTINAGAYHSNDIVDARFVFEHSVDSGMLDDKQPLDSTALVCRHDGYVSHQVINDDDIYGKVLLTIYHSKQGIPCDHIMNWKIEFVMYNPSTGVLLAPPRVRSGSLYAGVSAVEVFSGPKDYVLEYRMITSIEGGTSSSTDWITVAFS